MQSKSYANVDDYLQDVPVLQRTELARLRKLIIKTVPDATELISYGMPAYKYQGKPLVYFGAFKNHMSIFPTSGPTHKLQAKLAGYKVSKGAIQFSLENTLSDELIREILKIRIDEIINHNR